MVSDPDVTLVGDMMIRKAKWKNAMACTMPCSLHCPHLVSLFSSVRHLSQHRVSTLHSFYCTETKLTNSIELLSLLTLLTLSLTLTLIVTQSLTDNGSDIQQREGNGTNNDYDHNK